MADASSTTDIWARWLDQIHDERQPTDTRHFLFAQEDGHLLLQEPLTEEFVTRTTSPVTVLPPSTERITVIPRHENVSVPRAQHLSMKLDDRYILLRKYEGFVTSRGELTFTARLFESVTDYPVIEAEFDLEELSETDRTLAVEGAALVWTIGYRYDGSTRKRESVIYLRRLPPWSDKEIEESGRAAQELTRGIDWE